MRIIQKLISAAVLAMLASCATTGSTHEKYEANKAILQGSPKIKQRTIERCVARITLSSYAKRQKLADLANTTLDKVPQVYCSRIWNGLADGRVSYDDYNASLNQHDTPNMIRVIQGR